MEKNREKNIRGKIEQEEKIKKFLFIDDNQLFLESIKRFFGEIKNVELIFSECHSKEDALQAIKKVLPDVIFLDNDLQGKGNNDGIEVIDALKKENITTKIYSITSSQDPSVIEEYKKRNIEIVGKSKILNIFTKIEENI